MSLLMSDGHFHNTDKDLARITTPVYCGVHRTPGYDSNLSNDFAIQETKPYIQWLKKIKALGVDNIYSEYIKHKGRKQREGRAPFLPICFHCLKLQMIQCHDKLLC